MGTAACALAIEGSGLGEIERRLIDRFQHGVPLTPRPYAAMAAELGVDEAAVIQALANLAADGTLSRIGPVFAPNRIGASTLAAMAVPAERLDAVAELVSGYPEVNHNYEREHELTLWFVVTAPDRARLDGVLADIAERTGIAVLDLPLEAEYHIDLGFPIAWS